MSSNDAKRQQQRLLKEMAEANQKMGLYDIENPMKKYPWSDNKPLTDEEVQKLREQAKEYAKKGSKYLEGGELNLNKE